MNENIKLFLEKVAADQDLQAKFTQIKDVDEAYALASSIQDGFTKEEFVEEMTKIKAALDENLSDEDLAKSAGGLDETDTAIIVTVAESAIVSTFTTCAVAAAI